MRGEAGALSWSEEEVNAWLLEFVKTLQDDLEKEGVEIAHLKLSLSEDDSRHVVTENLVMDDDRRDACPPLLKRLAVANAVEDGRTAVLSRLWTGEFSGGELWVNLRGEGDPEVLQQITERRLRTEAERGGDYSHHQRNGRL